MRLQRYSILTIIVCLTIFDDVIGRIRTQSDTIICIIKRLRSIDIVVVCIIIQSYTYTTIVCLEVVYRIIIRIVQEDSIYSVIKCLSIEDRVVVRVVIDIDSKFILLMDTSYTVIFSIYSDIVDDSVLFVVDK